MKQQFLYLKFRPSDFDLIPYSAKFISRHSVLCGVNPAKEASIKMLVAKGLRKRLTDNIKNNGTVKISTFRENNRYVISIQDKGTPYLLNTQTIKLFKNGLCDDFQFLQLGNKGIITRIEYEILDKKESNIPTLKEQILLDKDFIVRKTKTNSEDINEVIKCLYDEYKYDYIHQNLYNCNKFKEIIRSGFYHSFLVENKHHQVCGHAALHEYYPIYGLLEYCNLVTKSIARGNGIAEKTLISLTEYAKVNKYNGVIVSCYAAHPYTEKICNKVGYTPCSAFFQMVDPSTAGEYKNKKCRFDLLNAVTLFDKSKKHIVYGPSYIKPLLDYVFKKENIEYELISDFNENLKIKTNISYNIDLLDKAINVYCESFDMRLSKNIKDIIKHRKEAGVELATFYINSSNPSAINTINLLRKNDFIFTGIIPGTNNGDYLIMQRFFAYEFSTKNTVIIENYDELVNIIKKINNLD